jgi:hypothetical protein
VSDTSEPTDNGPEVRFAMAALNAQMEQLYGPLPEVELPQSPEIDINVFRLDAAQAARTDIEEIQATYQRLTASTSICCGQTYSSCPLPRRPPRTTRPMPSRMPTNTSRSRSSKDQPLSSGAESMRQRSRRHGPISQLRLQVHSKPE